MTKRASKKKPIHICRIMLLIFAALILGNSVYNWNANNLAGNKLPMPFGIGLSVVLSGSMEPTLHVDDLVVIRKTDEIEVGDVLVYQSGKYLVIHRVLEISGDDLITKGDANSAADEAISMSDVKGVMVASIPKVGIVVQIIKNPVVVAAVLIAAVALTELSFRQDKQKDQKELECIEDEIRRLMAEIKKD